MLQLEVVRRLVAPAGARERGLVSLEVEAFADAKVLFTVPPRSFSPPPRVSSAVVHLSLHPPPASELELAGALAHAARAFCHRRKKLANALEGGWGELSVEEWLARAGVDSDLRPQSLTLADWIAIARAREAP
jgi:16S rRNA (adenine1518-N6/adenine1519-N6)-dimethyltransferase